MKENEKSQEKIDKIHHKVIFLLLTWVNIENEKKNYFLT